ncbi:hypothetical protein STVIR_3995 [Streptomyces viridochromogenes Tue57]|uniref:Uncharacterized protein n=1 Tax=Streptomyces viridochromogenes Tue57 TaxID=1160705 RepID=L8PGC7_STRVR|nr:hypothetical protein STVIR_3995 [Streptomyces viridochromogenes Tue57]
MRRPGISLARTERRRPRGDASIRFGGTEGG